MFDSSVQGGDAVWEGLRVYDGKIFHLDKHLDRLHASAKTLAFTDIPSKAFIKNAIKQTLKANGMTTDTHIRLTLTRGEKVTSGMDPRLNQKGSCLIVLAEFKPPVFDNAKGIKLVTSHVRRNSPMHLDSKIHHNNLLNNILAKIEANYCGADAAIMLDNLGFVSETNDCNIFMAKKGCYLRHMRMLVSPELQEKQPSVLHINSIFHAWSAIFLSASFIMQMKYSSPAPWVSLHPFMKLTEE